MPYEEKDKIIGNRISVDTFKKMRELLDKTRKDGNEYGFVLCSNKEITHSDTCTGRGCEVIISGRCKKGEETEGNFHTHPLYQRMIKTEKEPNSELIDASHMDLYNAYNGAYDKKFRGKISTKSQNGTVCVGNDINYEVMCYTIIDDLVTKENMKKLSVASKYYDEKFLRSAFNKEVIYLK